MEEKIRLEVLGISYSQIQSGVSALILSEVDGPMKIPVVIGQAEAQSIAIKLEGIRPPRPLTHDLFVSFTHAFGVKLQEVFIYKFEDGVFLSELTFTDGQRQVVLDARTSDAIAIAMRTHSPIYTTRTILDQTGFVMHTEPHHTAEEPSAAQTLEEEASRKPRLENYSVEELERELQSAIEREDYEEASLIQSILEGKRKNN